LNDNAFSFKDVKRNAEVDLEHQLHYESFGRWADL